ncbi:4-hydroxy-2-oxo-heptane-1,7-dioate aldolase [Acuticoccus sediminis]|uniref:4-hydroxy-2-oxo-heptane-1,7-dioate aldolase n=1 Tax=Acuticoccus sediminis TaxID=2184697 RepID=A0A8B2NZS1_9HYPH|nr:aldolase/citrate lyase family protein [Acuticoccus sediminis]RAI04321.1 4-hydroxy-2-oxo-heptane-1,7-dioate aldolase [Acuticoccus sediminis]
MELRRNAFKAAIQNGERQIGLWCSMSDSSVAEMLAGCGYDWLMFDTEHAALDPLSVLPLLQAVASYPVSAIVRPTSLNVAEIKKLLDCGAQTLLIPQIQNAEEARLAAASVAYPPEGIRGVAGLTRATGFGAIDGYARAAREEICLLVQIETKSALDDLEAICAVDGIDGVFIGPADLAASLGHAENPQHPDVKAAVADAVRRIRACGKPAGFLSLSQEWNREVDAAGSVFTAVDVDIAILRNGALARAKEWKSA